MKIDRIKRIIEGEFTHLEKFNAMMSLAEEKKLFDLLDSLSFDFQRELFDIFDSGRSFVLNKKIILPPASQRLRILIQFWQFLRVSQSKTKQDSGNDTRELFGWELLRCQDNSTTCLSSENCTIKIQGLDFAKLSSPVAKISFNSMNTAAVFGWIPKKNIYCSPRPIVDVFEGMPDSDFKIVLARERGAISEFSGAASYRFEKDHFFCVFIERQFGVVCGCFPQLDSCTPNEMMRALNCISVVSESNLFEEYIVWLRIEGSEDFGRRVCREIENMFNDFGVKTRFVKEIAEESIRPQYAYLIREVDKIGDDVTILGALADHVVNYGFENVGFFKIKLSLREFVTFDLWNNYGERTFFDATAHRGVAIDLQRGRPQ